MAIDQKELGQRLRGARDACGKTQDDVARQLGVSRSTVVQMAHHFGVSRAAACYRLKSARLLKGSELDCLLEQDRAGRGREIEKLLGLPEPDHQVRRNEFRHRFLGLALEAFRREEISRAKLVEVAAMVDVDASDVDRATSDLGLNDDGDAEVHLPGA